MSLALALLLAFPIAGLTVSFMMFMKGFCDGYRGSRTGLAICLLILSAVWITLMSAGLSLVLKLIQSI